MTLKVEHLLCTRAERPVFAPVSFDLAPGEALILRGANGAGKTTLLRALAGLMPVASGSAMLDGVATAEADGAIALTGHQDAIKPTLTVAENLTFWAAFDAPERLEAAMEHFALRPLGDRLAARLSAGQRRRLGLARLALTRARLWLLDEPTNSLDAENAARLVALIAAHLEAGGIAIIATHLDLEFNARTLMLEPPAEGAAAADPFLEGAF